MRRQTLLLLDRLSWRPHSLSSVRDTVDGMTIPALTVSVEEVASELRAALRGRSEIRFGNVEGTVLASFLFHTCSLPRCGYRARSVRHPSRSTSGSSLASMSARRFEFEAPRALRGALS